MDKYVWKRLSDVYSPEEINLLTEPPEINEDPDILTKDVVQGGLGDCYFLSAISALAEFPDRLRYLLPKIEFSPKGVFLVKVFIDGMPREICLDDWFPFENRPEGCEQELAFTRLNPKTKNLWPALLEKAWAKVNVCYEAIVAGNSAEAFEFLSPAPIETYYHELHKETLFNIIRKADKEKYIICSDIIVGENTNVNFLAKLGLISNHAYTVIDVAEVTDLKGKKTRLMKIRNPWGSHEWSGDWSDSSSKWTPELKKLLNVTEEDDGTFWMSYEDFCKFYTSTHICMIKTNWDISAERFAYDKTQPFNLVRVDIPEDTTGHFVVNLKNSRIYKHTRELTTFENKFCSVIIYKEINGDYVYMGATCGRKNRLYIEVKDLKKGRYYVAVSFPSKHEDSHVHDNHSKPISKTAIVEDNFHYRVGIYCPIKKLKIVDLKGDDELEKCKDFLKDVMFDLAKQNPNIYYFTEEKEKDTWRSISFEKEAGAYGFIAYENKSDAFIHEHLKFTQFYNLNLIPVLDKADLKSLNIQDDEVIEDASDRNTLSKLKSKAEKESSIKVLHVTHHLDVSQENPIELMVKVAPKSKCLILIEKTEEDATIELDSKLALTYPTHLLLDGTRFPQKKTRLKYLKKFVEIYENIVEHTAGVIFVYKNRSKDLKFSVKVTFPEFSNLILVQGEGANSSNKQEIIQIENNEIIETQPNTTEPQESINPDSIELKIEDPTKETIVTLEPGQTKFFELAAIDVFESYSYSCQMNYHISLARTKIR
jgi:hypothetical protein